MNYRHGFHAGNFADVVKHAVFTRALEYLQQKDKGLLILDTHAGKGLYRLDDALALKTNEARDGIARVLASVIEPPPAFASFVRILNAVRKKHGDNAYPGSPLIAASLLRPQDRLIVCELQPAEAKELAASLAPIRRARVLNEDGYHALKAQLPPPERRGVILIDPPFEQENEFEQVFKGLQGAVARFREGLYIAWLPVKDRTALEKLYGEIKSANIRDVTAVEWQVREAITGAGLTASALVMINAPFTIKDDLSAMMPWLMKILAQGPGAKWEFRRITPE